jgi:hypothetical protein
VSEYLKGGLGEITRPAANNNADVVNAVNAINGQGEKQEENVYERWKE